MFINLQPLTANSRLPQFMRSDLSLHEKGTGVRVPCNIMNVNITRTFVIPQEPVDSGQYVSDNIMTKPVTVALQLYVYENDIKEYFRIIKETQEGSHGFVFIDRQGTVYEDLYLTNISYEQAGEQLGAFISNVEFHQVLKVHALESTVVLKIPQGEVINKGRTQAVELTKEETSKVSKSLLKGGKGSLATQDLISKIPGFS